VLVVEGCDNNRLPPAVNPRNSRINVDSLTQSRLVVPVAWIADETGIGLEALSEMVKDHFGYEKEFLSVLDLFGVWSKCVYQDFDVAFKLNKLIGEILRSGIVDEEERANYTWIKAAIFYELSNNWTATFCEVDSIHPYFRKNHATLIPGSELIKVTAKQKKRPDFLVKVEGVVYPVECKIEFTNQGLKQLQGYMKIWNAEKGYAVARKLKSKLPKNIVFLQALS
jgi:hypothetical protein